jgi:hypothetical protein
MEHNSMAVFAVTFRIEYDNDYESRYESVVKAIKGAAATAWWDEPTSFLLIDYNGTSSALTTEIDASSTFASSKDLLLAINLSQKGYSLIGKSTDGDIKKLMEAR